MKHLITTLFSFKIVRILCFGSLLLLNLSGGAYFYFQLQEVNDTISEPILEERPYLNQILNMQRLTSELDLYLHGQLTGQATDISAPIDLIDKILAGLKILKNEVMHSLDPTPDLDIFSKELRRLRVALKYYRESRVYDSTSSSTEELYEIIDTSIAQINKSIINIISAVRGQMAQHDMMVLDSARMLQLNLLLFLAAIILGTLAVVYIFNMYIAENLKKLIDGTVQIGEGNLAWRIKREFNDEFGRLSNAFNNMAGNIADSQREILSQTEELAEKNRRLELEERKAQNYLDVASTMMVALNVHGEIVLINKKACSILNVSEEEALGTNWFSRFLPEEVVGQIKDVFKQLISGGLEPVEYYENEVLSSDGQKKIIAFHNTLVTNEKGEIEGVFFSGEDITLRKQAETEKERLKEQLRQVQKMEAIGTMAGGIAHDFNNILTAILGYAEFIKTDAPESSQLQDDIEQILKAGNRAKLLVGQILAFSRQEKLELVPIYPAVIIKEILKLLRSTIPTSVSIIQNISEDCGRIKADPTGLHQVLINLITNAVHAMDEKGQLTVTLQEAYLNAKAVAPKPGLSPGAYVRLSVSDTGTGMDPKMLERIFDPFFTTKEVGQGTGMGLAVVYGIVESHGGFINVESEPGRGSIFQVFFPVTDENGDGIPGIESRTELKTGNERILLVDDEITILELAERILESLGYEVTAEMSSVKALEIFRASPDRFELVVTDLVMPGITGIELRDEMLKIRPGMPVIICSGYSSKITAEYAAEHGIKEFVKKPYDKIRMSEAIREALNGKS